MNKLKVKVSTLGCKANQCDSFFIQNYLGAHNFEVLHDKSRADVCIINTCTVTSKSDFQSRQEIRRAIRNNSGAKVYVTGCYAVTGENEIRAISGVTDVIPPGRISDFLQQLSNSLPAPFSGEGMGINNLVEHFPGRTRAFFKIQDGCNFRCSYCIVPFARGKSRSLKPQDVISGLKRYAELGYKEVVLTGVHLGSYGLDLSPRTSLSALLEEIADKISGIRIRISSLDPNEIDNKIITLVSSSSVFCRHFHIPLQSGDNRILKLMRRNYTADKFREVVLKIKEKIPDAGIGIDVIAGFPGEKEEEFENTYKLIESLPLSYLHVFPFSLRKGTAAEKLPDKIHGSIIKERTRKLIQLGKLKRKSFYNGFIGRTLSALVEKGERKGFYKGFSDNYIPVVVEGERVPIGEIINIRINKLNNLTLLGEEWDTNG